MAGSAGGFVACLAGGDVAGLVSGAAVAGASVGGVVVGPPVVVVTVEVAATVDHLPHLLVTWLPCT